MKIVRWVKDTWLKIKGKGGNTEEALYYGDTSGREGGFNIKRLFFDIKRKIVKVYNKIIEKGSERVTIMFIPHSEKSIFNFQVSVFTLVFVALILLGMLSFAVWAINTNKSETSKRIASQNKLVLIQEELMSSRKNLVETTMRFKRGIHDIKQKIDEYFEEVDNLKRIVFGGNRFDFKGVGGPEYDITNLKNGMGADVSQLFEISSLARRIDSSIAITRNLSSFLIKQKEFLKYIPSVWPVKGGGKITSGFGIRRSPFTGRYTMHKGIDIAWFAGTPIIATAPGEVTFSGWGLVGYGIAIKIKHKYGYKTVYAHLLRTNVRVGQKVRRGQIIGLMGATGRATGVHLHYEVWIGNQRVNPAPFLTIRF